MKMKTTYIRIMCMVILLGVGRMSSGAAVAASKHGPRPTVKDMIISTSGTQVEISQRKALSEMLKTKFPEFFGKPMITRKRIDAQLSAQEQVQVDQAHIHVLPKNTLDDFTAVKRILFNAQRTQYVALLSKKIYVEGKGNRIQYSLSQGVCGSTAVTTDFIGVFEENKCTEDIWGQSKQFIAIKDEGVVIIIDRENLNIVSTQEDSNWENGELIWVDNCLVIKNAEKAESQPIEFSGLEIYTDAQLKDVKDFFELWPKESSNSKQAKAWREVVNEWPAGKIRTIAERMILPEKEQAILHAVESTAATTVPQAIKKSRPPLFRILTWAVMIGASTALIFLIWKLKYAQSTITK